MSLQLTELTARFNMSEMKRPNVRRCLFGRPDPEKQTEYFDKQEQIFRFEEDARRFRDDWSFDPVTGPIEGGKFEFEIINAKSNAPSFYTRGYSRKPKPVVRSVREKGFCSFNDCSRPAKRKLELESQENDENEVLDKRVPSKGDLITFPQMMHHLSATLPDFKDNGLFDSATGLINCSSTASSLAVLSPTSRNRDITTPSRPRSLVQSSMKDFLSNKKQRLLNTKTLPRT